jgi:hypothetical protein
MFDALNLFADAATVTASGNSPAVDVNSTPVDGVTIKALVTAVSGTTPTLDIKVQESNDGTTWNDTGVAFPQITAVGKYQAQVYTSKKKLRLVYTVGGTTPSFTLTAGIVPTRD